VRDLGHLSKERPFFITLFYDIITHMMKKLLIFTILMSSSTFAWQKTNILQPIKGTSFTMEFIQCNNGIQQAIYHRQSKNKELKPHCIGMPTGADQNMGCFPTIKETAETVCRLIGSR